METVPRRKQTVVEQLEARLEAAKKEEKREQAAIAARNGLIIPDDGVLKVESETPTLVPHPEPVTPVVALAPNPIKEAVKNFPVDTRTHEEVKGKLFKPDLDLMYNMFKVGNFIGNDRILIPPGMIEFAFPRARAINLAAWLLIMAGAEEEELLKEFGLANAGIDFLKKKKLLAKDMKFQRDDKNK